MSRDSRILESGGARGVAEALRWTVEQPGVNVVVAYAQDTRDRDAFVKALEDVCKRHKTIVFMKLGRSGFAV